MVADTAATAGDASAAKNRLPSPLQRTHRQEPAAARQIYAPTSSSSSSSPLQDLAPELRGLLIGSARADQV
ncbi:hypothetical protein [Oryza sativa Japonica Group]|uniref:Uncharacterized protein n=2 Tax=Oryza sativa subsp. japonica TaxID=39947 RepID=Q5JNA9_ORYSJ|nr:hypothetical protein [Oryza sativa Japonica Group]BAD88405.1 hypothetical protein [Oryza sativa Japonica Group]BAS76492.1 Os01g0978250 [Oryza sativa Japonica Group]